MDSGVYRVAVLDSRVQRIAVLESRVSNVLLFQCWAVVSNLSCWFKDICANFKCWCVVYIVMKSNLHTLVNILITGGE